MVPLLVFELLGHVDSWCAHSLPQTDARPDGNTSGDIAIVAQSNSDNCLVSFCSGCTPYENEKICRQDEAETGIVVEGEVGVYGVVVAHTK